MNFFDTVDSMAVAENHIQEVYNLEQTEAKKLMKRYKEVRQELRDRLSTIRGDSFTAQKLRGVLVQVESALEAQGRALKSDMADSADILQKKGIKHLITEINKFSKEFEGAVIPVNIDAARIENQVGELLVSKYESSLDAYTAYQRQYISESLTQSVIAEDTLGETVKRLSDYMTAEEWRLLRIARTELHGAYSLAKMKGLESVKDKYIPDMKKALIHPMDSRTGADSKYLASLNPVVDINEPFSYRWAGKIRKFMTPPDRPNDRAILVPYREAWNS